jgi:hypothetical protein
MSLLLYDFPCGYVDCLKAEIVQRCAVLFVRTLSQNKVLRCGL